MNQALTRFLTRYVLGFAMVWILVSLAVTAQVLYPGFFDIGNIKNLLAQTAPEGVIAVAMTFVIIGGSFDLSAGAILSLAGTLFASMAVHDISLIVAGIISILIAGLAGLCSGIAVTRFRVNSFIATLGTASIFSGATLLYSHSAPFSPGTGLGTLGLGSALGVPIAVLILAAVALVGGLVLHGTVYGRSVFVIGGNSDAARLAGLRVGTIRGGTFVISGVCAGLAGIILASRTGVGQAGMDDTAALNTITMVVVGGTSLFGGEGAMWRTATGVLLIGVVNNLFDSMALSSGLRLIVTGGVVIAAVAVDAYTRHRRAGTA